MTLPGIDISHWQNPTPTLTGLSFCFAKASEGLVTDALYATHKANIQKAGLVLGAYHFARSDVATPSTQAGHFISTAGPDVHLYALDVEGEHAFTLDQSREFVGVMHAAGKEIGMYHSDSGFPDAGQDWNWVAKWGTTPPARSWAFWQWQGSPLDKDTFNGDLAALQALTKGAEVFTTLTVLPFGGTYVIPAGKAVSGFIFDPSTGLIGASKTRPASANAVTFHYDAVMTTTATRGNPFIRGTDADFAGFYLSAGQVDETPLGDTTPHTDLELKTAREAGYAAAKTNAEGASTKAIRAI